MSQQTSEPFRPCSWSTWARAVFGHTHFPNPDSLSLSALASQTASLHPSTSIKTDWSPSVEGLSLRLFTECNWIRAYFFLHRQLLLHFLSSLCVISLTFPSVAYDKLNWPSLYSKEAVFYSPEPLFPVLFTYTHLGIYLFLFWRVLFEGMKVIRNIGMQLFKKKKKPSPVIKPKVQSQNSILNTYTDAIFHLKPKLYK